MVRYPLVGTLCAVFLVLVFFGAVEAQASSMMAPEEKAGSPCPLRQGLPDLKVESIGFLWNYGEHGCEVYAFAAVVNDGNESAVGPITLSYSVKRLATAKTVASDSLLVAGHLSVGETVIPCLTHSRYLPKLGLFRLTCEVNPGRTVNESEYQNNMLSGVYLDFCGLWFPRTTA